MKKIITLILLFISIISFGQNKEYRKAVNLFNDKKYTEANTIIEKLLNKEYGELEVSQEFYCLQMNLNSYSILNDFKTAYDKSIVYFEYIKNSKTLFVDDNAKRKTIAETEKFIADLKLKIPKDTKTLLETNIASESSSTVKIDNLETKVAETTKPLSDDKTVTLTVSGTGKTLEEAKLNALRSAIEQAFGAFISSKTEILNDNLVRDEIVSVASGNVQKFDIVSQVEVANIGYAMTLNAIVSISKLTSFAESKGIVVEFKGGLFGANIRLQKLNEESELIAVKNLCKTSFEMLLNSVDYTLSNSEPKQVNGKKNNYRFDTKNGLYLKDYDEGDYQITFEVKAISNENLKLFYNYFKSIISSLKMNEDEVETYKKLSKETVNIKIEGVDYYLRNKECKMVIYDFFYKTNIIPATFEVNCNIENFNYILSNRAISEHELEEESEESKRKNNQWNFINCSFNQIGRGEVFRNRFSDSFEEIITSKLNLYPEFKSLFFQNPETGNEILKKSIKNEENYAWDNDKITDKIGLNEMYNFEINFRNFERNFIFTRYYKLTEIEKIDKFEVKKFGLYKTLKDEEVRIKKSNLILLYNQNCYQLDKFITELDGSKINCDGNYSNSLKSSSEGIYVELVEKNINYYLIKSINPYKDGSGRVNIPGKIFKLIPSKEIIQKEF